MIYEWLLLSHFVGIGAWSFALYRIGRRAGRRSCFRQRRVWPMAR